METGTEVSEEDASALIAERDALQQRCAAAEAEVRRLSSEVEHLRRDLDRAGEGSTLSLFDGAPAASPTRDSDPRVLSLILAATAVVAAMVAFLALLNGKLTSPIGLIMIVLALGLGWAAARTRVVPIEVSVTRGVVSIVQGDSSHRFDLRKPETVVEMIGRPGESGWTVRFPRRHLEPFEIDSSMVDPHVFTRQVREFRPNL
ncbi:MAG: hypothetical protein L0H31_06375 [Nocardioidaceae bacterium]|nr:hypothetical protein [Nocardioidaceae bacterium]